VIEWDNLWLAYRKAAKGKRGKASAARFEYRIADQLLQLQSELQTRTYRPGAYTHFTIHEPKRRKISAAPFRDRVVHHALCNMIEPLFERRFIANSFANRVGKGTHLAVDKLQHYARHYRYALRMDIVQHFPSIDHLILRERIAEVVREHEIMGLIDLILQSGAGVLTKEYDMVYFPGDDLWAIDRPRGLPIGNLTSQFWSNVYMNQLDWFVISDLGCQSYLRYVDDCALFSDNKRRFWQWKNDIARFLHTMRLTNHENSAQVQPVTHGIPWLGFVVFPAHRRLKRRNIINFRQRLQRNLNCYKRGKITFAEFDASVQGWINHVRYGDTWGLRKAFLGHVNLTQPKANGASQRKAVS